MVDSSEYKGVSLACAFMAVALGVTTFNLQTGLVENCNADRTQEEKRREENLVNICGILSVYSLVSAATLGRISQKMRDEEIEQAAKQKPKNEPA
jgi:hypothetical protein